MIVVGVVVAVAGHVLRIVLLSGLLLLIYKSWRRVVAVLHRAVHIEYP